jgi:hypothetical protein
MLLATSGAYIAGAVDPSARSVAKRSATTLRSRARSAHVADPPPIRTTYRGRARTLPVFAGSLPTLAATKLASGAGPGNATTLSAPGVAPADPHAHGAGSWLGLTSESSNSGFAVVLIALVLLAVTAFVVKRRYALLSQAGSFTLAAPRRGLGLALRVRPFVRGHKSELLFYGAVALVSMLVGILLSSVLGM